MISNLEIKEILKVGDYLKKCSVKDCKAFLKQSKRPQYFLEIILTCLLTIPGERSNFITEELHRKIKQFNIQELLNSIVYTLEIMVDRDINLSRIGLGTLCTLAKNKFSDSNDVEEVDKQWFINMIMSFTEARYNDCRIPFDLTIKIIDSLLIPLASDMMWTQIDKMRKRIQYTHDDRLSKKARIIFC